MSKFNLDDDSPAVSPASPVPSETLGGELVVRPKASATRRDVASIVASGNSIQAMYDAKKKLIFCVDCSGSMKDIVAGATTVEMYDWAGIDAIRKEVADVWNAYRSLQELTLAVCEGRATDADLACFTLQHSYNLSEVRVQAMLRVKDYLDPAQEERFKLEYIRSGAAAYLTYVPFKDPLSAAIKQCSKFELMKKVAGKLVVKRFDDVKNTDVSAVFFNDESVSCTVPDKDKLLEFIKAREASGGTDIIKTINYALAIIGRNPSPIGLNHIVLASDGQDFNARQFEKFIPIFKQMRVVLDFIYITQPFLDPNAEYAEAIRKTVEAVGGTYTVITDADGIQTALLERGSRLLLPPPAV